MCEQVWLRCIRQGPKNFSVFGWLGSKKSLSGVQRVHIALIMCLFFNTSCKMPIE